jgi:hypothetical protein
MTTNRVRQIASARMDRIGQFPVILRAEVATRPEVYTGIVAMLKGAGLTNVQCIVTDRMEDELIGPRPYVWTLTDSTPISLLALGLYLTLGVSVLFVTRWASRQYDGKGPDKGELAPITVNPVRSAFWGVMVSVTATVLAEGTRLGALYGADVGAPWLTDLSYRVGRFAWWINGPAGSILSLLDMVLSSRGQEVAGAVTFTVGMILNGAIGAWVGYVLPAVKSGPNPRLGTRSVALGRWFLVVLPIVLPAVFYVAYRPVHLGYVGELFGCGCCGGFNANCVNLLLWTLALLLSWTLLLVTVRYVQQGWRTSYLVLGVVATTMTTGWSSSMLTFM